MRILPCCEREWSGGTAGCGRGREGRQARRRDRSDRHDRRRERSYRHNPQQDGTGGYLSAYRLCRKSPVWQWGPGCRRHFSPGRLFRVNAIVARETDVIRAQLRRNGIAIHQGTAHFLDPHTVEVQDAGEGIKLEAAKILIACGTRPAHSPGIPFDNRRIVDTDHLAELDGLPKEIIVVGAGVVGLEYASFMAALGAEVTLIDQRPVVLDFVDRQIVEALSYHLRQLGVTFRLGEKVTHVGIDPVRDRVFAQLENGKKVQDGSLVYALGRQANGDQLHLEAAG